MYNNSWYPNQNMIYQNAIPNVYPNYQNAQNYIPSENQQHQLSHDMNEDNTYGYWNERQPEAYLYIREAKQNRLGDKFWSFSWKPETVKPGQYLIAFLHAPNMNVINGGWKISSPNDRVFAIESYDRKLDQWVITLYNNSQNTKQVTFTLIAKER
ncbi:hypothetical protein CN603_13015 [Bacillus toyonensis]|uniref:hypothetical protein n=1 Tax=Bacillus toyonensis TaxID=155322 RepID=UPI000BEF663D|nr:hypothetical protein [Bacillus toyonensis]PEL75402.1 hypothetical protein CN603_13015 [Bacillus toyonensis]